MSEITEQPQRYSHDLQGDKGPDKATNGHVGSSHSLEEACESPLSPKECLLNILLGILRCFIIVFQAVGSCFYSFCNYGEPESTEPGSEILPPWRMLWVEFVNRTTWHGLKYLELRSRFWTRKLIWSAVMTSNIILFLYIMTTKLQLLLTYPVAVSVQVTYGQSPPFSAVTICNHNPYRMTVMHQNGLHDIMVSDLDDSCSYCNDYMLHPGICRVNYKMSRSQGFHLEVNDVTRKVCMFMCANAYDSSCSGFLYDRHTRSCTLTSYTGEWLDATDPPCHLSNGLEFYRRIRKAALNEIICTFEDALCPLESHMSENDAFVLTEAESDDVRRDNTLNLGSGHVMSLRTTELKSGFTARMSLPYVDTTGFCLELFYWLKLEDRDSGDLPSLKLSVLTEEKEKIELVSTSRYLEDWSRLFTRLPSGLHQIVIEGTRSVNMSSGVSIDDLTIDKCFNFDKSRNCKRTRRGTSYMGTVSTSDKGETCISWDQVKSPLIYRLPDDSPKEAKNYCRNIPQENWSEPSCLVNSNNNVYVSTCKIPYCECFNSTYFKCDSGLCLPPSLLCNGVQDCLDGSDEMDICSERQNVACFFNDDYLCGYTTESVGHLTWTRVPSTELSSYTDVTIYRNVIALSHLMFLDSKLGQSGDMIQLISPRWNFTSWTSVTFTYIIIGSGINDSEDGSLSLYQYSALRSPTRLISRLTPTQSRDFRQEVACIPPGRYHLMFLGVLGMPYEQMIGLPYVELGASCIPDNSTTMADSTEITSVETDDPISFNCSFMSLCGYKFLSTTRHLNWNLIYAKNALNAGDPTTVCNQTFKGVQGFIYSPNYPKDYPTSMNCNFEIDEPEGTTITIVFHEFYIESQSDCLFDRLEIYDPKVNLTKTYCGGLLPPKFMSKGNKLQLRFISDDSENLGKFKIQYFTYADKATEYAIAFKYSPPSALNKFLHKATLTSPPMSISSRKCLVVTMIAVVPFKIKLAHLDQSSKYHEKTILTSSTSLGLSWHKQWLDLNMLEKEFVVKYEFEVSSPEEKDPALIGDIKTMEGLCRHLPELQSSTLQCNFGNVTQCGYIDRSDGPVHWFRAYSSKTNGFSMVSSFSDGQNKQAAILQSADVHSSDSEECLQINYITGYPSFFMMVSSSNSLDASNVTQKLETGGEFQINYPLKPSVGSRSITIMTTYTYSAGNKDDTSERDVRLRKIEVLKGACPTAVEDTAKVDCSFDNFVACNYKMALNFGASWSWASWSELTNDTKAQRNGVLYFRQTRRSTLKGVMSPPLSTSNSFSILHFQAYTTNASSTNLSIMIGNSLGLPITPITAYDVAWIGDKIWQNVTVCIPPGDWHLFFVADVPFSSGNSPFVAIDNVAFNEIIPTNRCEPKMDAFTSQKCYNNDLTNCPQSLISWSTAMSWMKANNAPSSFSQSKEGCLHVFDQSEGWFNYRDTSKQYKNKSECDIYIRANSRMTVQLRFDEFEIKDCMTQNIQIWYRNYDGITSTMKMCSRSNVTSSYDTDRIIQIHINSHNGYPKVRFRYKYTTISTEGYMFGLYYDGITKYNESTDLDSRHVVGTWISPELSFDQSSAAEGLNYCIRVDLLLSHLSLDAFSLHQQSMTNFSIVPIFSASSHKYDNQGWTNATFQMKTDKDFMTYPDTKHQLMFTFSIYSKKKLNESLTLLAAIDNLKIEQGFCHMNDPSSPTISCKSSDRSSCQFVDISSGASRWITTSYLSRTASNNTECQLSDNGYVYMGSISNTIFGRTCQRWDSQFPHRHNQDVADYFPDTSMNSTGNKCRNPSNPFIPRNVWCYTTDVSQRREFCDIPLCVESYFQAELDTVDMSPALFITKLAITSVSCLTFSYDTTTTLVHVEIFSREAPDGSDIFKALLKREQATTSLNWISANITVTPRDKYLVFLGRKTDVTSKNQYAYLSNITVVPGGCAGEVQIFRKSRGSIGKANNRLTISKEVGPTYERTIEAYRGPRLNRAAYQDALLNETANETMGVLNNKMAHQMDDLIHSCRFNGMDCQPGDLISQMTDMGQCYTFNWDGSKSVDATGSMSGLSLILNVEQYEHVPEYVSGVGVRIHLHDIDEIPSMQALGLAAETGVHSFGILSCTKTENLQPPFGHCGEVPLNLTSEAVVYSESKCRLERNTLELEHKCMCREPYMSGNGTVCDLRDYLRCSKKATLTNVQASECPSACAVNSFSVQLSQSKLSGLRISEVLGNKSAAVQERFLRALETNNRIDATHFGDIVVNMETSTNDLLKLRDYIYFSLVQFETSTIKHIEVAIQTFVKLAVDEVQLGGLEMISSSDKVYYQDYQPKLSYLLASMRNVYDMLAFYKDVQFEAYSNTNKTDAKAKWYKQVTNDTYLKLVFLNETSTIFSRERNSQMKIPATCPYFAAGEKFVQTLSKADCNCLYRALEERIQEMLLEFEKVIEILQIDDDPFSTFQKQVRVEKINEMLELLRETSRCKSRYEVISNEVKNWLKSDSIFPEMKNYTTEIVSQNMLINFNEIQTWISILKDSYLSGNITLKDMAANVTGRMGNHMRKITAIISDISQRVVVPILESMTTTETSIVKLYQDYLGNLVRLDNSSEFTNFESYAKNLKIWRKPTVNLEMPEARNYLLSESDIWQVWPTQEPLASFYGSRSRSRLSVITSSYFNPLRNRISTFTNELTERYEKVKKNSENLNSKLVKYFESTIIDDDFIMSNFLMLDIYYGELKFDTVSASPSYVWVNFFSDLGSYFGLLMGCSVLTMFEVVDLILYHSVVKAVEYYEQRKQKRRHVININIPAPLPTSTTPESHKSVTGILNRAFSPERKSGNSTSSGSTSIYMSSDSGGKTECSLPSLPSYHSNTPAIITPWNIQL